MYIDQGRVIARIYDHCLSPTEEQLPLQWVLTEVERVDASLCTDLDNTNQFWRLETAILEVEPFTDEYSFSAAGNFARACMVEINPFIGGVGRRRVQIADIQDQARYTTAGISEFLSGISIPGLSTFGLEEVGFYRKKNGQVFARVSPPPTRAFSLTIYYEPLTDLELQDADVLASFRSAQQAAFPLLEVRASFNLLSGLDHKPESVIQRKLRALESEIAYCTAQWNDYRMQDNQEEDSGVIEGFTLGRRYSGRGYVG